MPTITDTAVRNAKPRLKPYRLSDGDCLYLLVSPTGAKSWQLRYMLGTRQMTASLGKYPATPIAKARHKAQEARALAAEGKHVTAERNVARAMAAVAGANTFKTVAAEWVTDTARNRAWSQDHKEKVIASLQNHLSKLEPLPVTAITALMCDPELRKVEASAPDAARKVYQRLQSILDYAHGRGLIPSNPLPRTRSGAKPNVKHFPAVLSATGVGEILRNAERSNVAQGVQRAHVLCAFTAQRISEVVGAEWGEINFDAATWTIPRARMKRHDANLGPHVVPLPPALLARMREWHRIDGGAGYVPGTDRWTLHFAGIGREVLQQDDDARRQALAALVASSIQHVVTRRGPRS